MIVQQGVERVARESRLDPAARSLQNVVRQIYANAGDTGERIANLLYGTWFGHPLHPALTDIPIGAWTAATVLDLLSAAGGSKRLARCADAAVAIGVVGGTAAILAGFTDWQHVRGQPQRLGLIHAIVNVGTTLFQAVSLGLRGLGARGAGQALSAASYSSLLLSAYLGGEMIQRHRIGVNRASEETVPADYKAVMFERDLPESQLRQVDVDGSPVLLVRRGDRVYAMHAICTHQSGRLPQGSLVDDIVQCPLHGSRFALADGHVVRGPASFAEQCLATRVRNGQIEVGPGAGLGRCRHEPVTAPQAQEVAAAPAYR